MEKRKAGVLQSGNINYLYAREDKICIIKWEREKQKNGKDKEKEQY